MIPMLRTLARAASAADTVLPTSSSGWWLHSLPAVVSEGLVGLGHLVGVLAPLHAGAEAVARVEQLVHKALDHGLLAAGASIGDQPAQTQGRLTWRAHFDRHLVGRATDAAAAYLEGRLHVVHRALERDHRVGTGLLLAALKSAVHDALRQGALAAH